MNKILEINTENMTATVEPGVIWSNLEKELSNRGLTLRAFPSSSNNSTVAGWVAQGGSGFGSNEFGDCLQNIVSVEMVLPNGQLKTFVGEDLFQVYSLCGITGLIVSVTVRAREKDEESVILSAFPNMQSASEYFCMC